MLFSKKIFLACAIILLSINLLAQTNQMERKSFLKGSWELNLSGDMGSITSSTEYESGEYSDESSTDYKYFQLHLIPGYFITDGFSFEPELDFLFVEKEKPSYSLIPMLSYTYLLPSNNHLAIYIRGGYGLTNSFSAFGILVRQSDALDIGVINIGAGLKIIATENFCIRTEINYRRTSNTEEESSFYGSYKTTNTLSNIRLLLGLSVLL